MIDEQTPIDPVNSVRDRTEVISTDVKHETLISELLNHMNSKQYAYNFTWFGRPIIQIPQDTVTFQELIWQVQPDLIIETGVAHGGSLLFSASMLALLETFGLVDSPKVLGIDIDIRPHNRAAIESHPASRWIRMLEGSSISHDVLKTVKSIASEHRKILVFLDSNHTHHHVLSELYAYTPFVTPGSYCVVLDTGIEDIDPSAVKSGRPWCKGNSPKSALNEFLSSNTEFILDDFFHQKAWLTSAPGGFIKRVKSDVS
jgi:cephalosporin hydroxylase